MLLPDKIDIDADLSEPASKKPFPLISAHQLTLKPIMIQWLLEGIIELGSLILLFGPSAIGKSLFGFDWGFCLASNQDWHGRRTRHTDVVIVAGEGYAGVGRRLKALEVKYGRPVPKNLYISQRPANLIDEKNAQWLADSIAALCPNPGLIIVDTLHRNMSGDENSSSDIAQLVANLDKYLKPLGASVLIVHHSGHDNTQRSRGSSSIRAAMDAEFSITKDGENVVLTCTKAKDFEAFKPQQFTIKPVELPWMDDEGEPLKSVVLEYSGDAMFTTVQNGDINMTMLSENLGKVASSAAAAGVPIETIGAAIAAINRFWFITSLPLLTGFLWCRQFTILPSVAAYRTVNLAGPARHRRRK